MISFASFKIVEYTEMQGTTTVEYRWSRQNYCRNPRAAATEAQAPTHHHFGSAGSFPFTFQTSCKNFLSMRNQNLAGKKVEKSHFQASSLCNTSENVEGK